MEKNETEFETQMKKIFNRCRKVKAEKCEVGYEAAIIIKNKTKKTWPIGSIKFIIDEDKSNIVCKDENIKYPEYEINQNQDGDFYFIFDEKTQIREYCCFFDVFFDGKKLEDTKLELLGKIKND